MLARFVSALRKPAPAALHRAATTFKHHLSSAKKTMNHLTMVPASLYNEMMKSALCTPAARRDAWRWTLSHRSGVSEVRYDSTTKQLIDKDARHGDSVVVSAREWGLPGA